ncbi:MAG: hypothetical protein IPM45_14225 [Acidimicrobiales bacterium]|nr:hypothetical protein [Acidimicrobiales bacterium]
MSLAAAAAVEVVEPPSPATERSPVDVLRLVVAGSVLVVLALLHWLAGDGISQFLAELFGGLTALPSWLLTAVVVVTRVGTVAMLVGGAVASIARGRLRFLLTVILGAALGVALFAGIDALADGNERPAVAEASDSLGPVTSDEFPPEVVAAGAGLMTAGAPFVARRWRRVGWALVFGLAVGSVLGADVSVAVPVALVAGWVAGALVLVLLGAPSRRAAGHAVAAGLVRAGIPLARLERAKVDARGSTPYFGRTADGDKLFVKVLGADERSADTLFRLWRRIVPHDLGDEKPFTSLRRTVEHELLVSLAAHDQGVRTPQVAAFARVEPSSFVLAYEAIEGRSLDGVEPAEVTDEVLASLWEQVALLRAKDIAHRDLRLANLFLAADGRVWMIDFGFSELAASDLLLATDLAELVSSLSLQVGAERAVASGVAAVGAAAVRTAIPRLRPAYRSGATRTAMKQRPELLDEVRARVEALPAA